MDEAVILAQALRDPTDGSWTRTSAAASTTSPTGRCWRSCRPSRERSRAGSKLAPSNWATGGKAGRVRRRGGIVSHLLANIALDGLERLFAATMKTGKPVQPFVKKGMNRGVMLIRYADDFVTVASSKEALEEHVIPKVEAFPAERGLSLSQKKTRVTTIDAGFSFLGFEARKFNNGKLLIHLQKAKVLAHLREIKACLKANMTVPAGAVVRDLAPVIRGWTNYYRHACSAHTFAYADYRVWKMLWAWARRRHPKKSESPLLPPNQDSGVELRRRDCPRRRHAAVAQRHQDHPPHEGQGKPIPSRPQCTTLLGRATAGETERARLLRAVAGTPVLPRLYLRRMRRPVRPG
jgi:Group II intron, maturase-specific domain/Reverse transcriptase (RNA-dependent DNA polymerase)